MLKFINFFLLVILFNSVGILDVHAATINAESCSQTDVQRAIDSASDGDIVMVPDGECTWTTAVKIGKVIWTKPVTYKSKQIIVQGTGIDNTIVTVGDANTPNDIAFSITTEEGKPVRISSFTFQGGVGTGEKGSQAVIALRGTSKKWRIDHIKFNKVWYRSIRIGGYTFGVIDHNIFYKSGSAIYVSLDNDASWNRPLGLGTENAVYIEDNVFDFTSAASRASVDSGGGARYVFRNNMTNSTAMDHGTETTGRSRSGFSFEIYNNIFANTEDWWSAMHIRGGTGVIFNNTATGYQGMVHVDNYRDSDTYKFWGKCDGTSPYDMNDGVTYESGVSAEDNSVGVLTVSGKNWVANQ